MIVYILNTSFEKIGIIDYCASIIWTRRYCDVGDFELYIPASNEILNIIKVNNLVMREDNTESLMVIESIVLTTDTEYGNYVTVSGRSIESYIAKRIVWQQTNLNGKLTDAVTKLLNENMLEPVLPARKIPGIEIGTYCECDISISKQVTGTNLMEAVKNLLSTYRLGFRIVFDGNKLRFEIYEGTDRSYNQSQNPYVAFSNEYDNILSSEYSYNIQGYANVALVAGEGQGIDRKRYVVCTIDEGIKRVEKYVDARDISSYTESGTLSRDEYDMLLYEKGKEVLTETSISESFNGTVEAQYSFVYNKDYFLGDVVQILNEFGIGDAVRITEVTEAWDENGYSCIPTFSTEEV